MSQSKVSDFFATKKGNLGLQPSKRRKIETGVNVSEGNVETILSPPLATRTRSKRLTVPDTQVSSKSHTATTKRTRAKKNKVCDVNQKSIAELFGSVGQKDEITTAIKDDHNASPPCSPSKRYKKDTTKRTRVSKTQDVLQAFEENIKTPDRGFDFAKTLEKTSVSARKKLVLKSPTSEKNKTSSSNSPLAYESENNADKTSAKAAESSSKSVGQSENNSDETAPKTEDNQSKSVGQVKPVTQTPLVDSAALKAKLMASGKFAELQTKLAEFDKKKKLAESPIKKAKARLISEETSQSSPKPPAHERFESLAEKVAPSLTLPSKYKLLEDFFRGADQVVSMLHKRSEVCTFAKLKAAVQQLVRRNFEEKNLGQIKTVYPQAYTFRQEKGLPSLTGGKQNTHQLTIEANLDTLPNQTPLLDKYGKPVFTASHLTDRISNFHRRIVNVVKRHHKEFLAKLNLPLQVDDKEIKRWHPKFNVDAIPDIEVSPLPQPPDVQKLTTASEVLEHAKGTLNARIQRALMLSSGQIPAKVCSKKESAGETTTVKPQDEDKSKTSSDTSKQTCTNLAGVSQSLLERIRAKEAAKTEAAMLRSPEEEIRLKRIERLPELARILRNVFVTQKKPALLMDEVINKMGESYKSNMGRAESEKHVELLVELVPDWIQIVQIKRGRFMKLDKNKDVSAIQEKLEKLFKAAK